jgi:hypothetical protein
MLANKSEQKTLSGLQALSPVPRKLTMAGGFQVPTAGLPAKPSGRTGVDGELLKPELADAKEEARRLFFELQHGMATMGEELFGDRPVVTDEQARELMLRLGDFRKYVQVVAQQQLVPFQCPRCQAAKTDDPRGDAMCSLCITMAYRRVPR